MVKKQKLFSLFAILAGIMLSSIGLLGISFYFYSGLQALEQPDKSELFWFLPFLFFGTMLIGCGIYFFIIGIRSRSGNESDYKLAKNSLIILTLLLIALLAIVIFNSI